MTRSTFKLEVGQYKDGSMRHEIRHANDLKIAHPDSLAAPIHRPALGRPPTSKLEDQTTRSPDATLQQKGSTSTDTTGSEADWENGGQVNKPTVAPSTHAGDAQNSNVGGKRPVRSTRNQNPLYVDSLEVSGPPPFRGFPAHRTWSASKDEIEALNRSINATRDSRSP